MTATDRPTIPAPVRADRAAGVVVGSAAGDALGAGFEFSAPLDPSIVVEMDGGGPFDWAPGEWTDDTQMALAVLTPLSEGDADPLPAIEDGFRRWFASRPPDVGAQTTTVLRSAGSLADAARALARSHPDRSGNGSLMRTGPVALAHPGDPEAVAELARRVSLLTHASDDCVDACVLWSVAIDHTLHHAPVRGAYEWTDGVLAGLDHLPAARREVWADRIEAARHGRPEDFPQNGWVVHALQAALSTLCCEIEAVEPWAGLDLQVSLVRAVQAGGDTDTVAAIAGALLGARWGATALPLRWRRVLHGRRAYDEPALAVADLEQMARLAARGGRADAQGWPGAESLMGHYEASWPGPPRSVELHGVTFGNVAALDGALAAGADTVISLCRMGTDDVPPDVDHHVLGLLDSTPDENPNAVLLLTDATTYLLDLVAARRRPFVHCVQAENRTPACAITWLLQNGAAPDDAVRQVAEVLGTPQPWLVDAATALRTRTRPSS